MLRESAQDSKFRTREELQLFQFNPTNYGPFTNALQIDRLPELGPGTEVQAMQPKLTELANSLKCKQEIGKGCLAGLWLWYDFLEESHQISQAMHSSTGSYWHGIMHRREMDFGNAKYWFRQTGSHPVFAELAKQVAGIEDAPTSLKRQPEWDPFHFVDLCEQALRSGEHQQACQQVQKLEWELLFDYCYREGIA